MHSKINRQEFNAFDEIRKFGGISRLYVHGLV